MKRTHLLGSALLLLAALIWGLAFVAQRVGMEQIGPYTFTAARSILAAVFVGIVFVLSPKRVEPGRRERRKRDTLIGGVLCGVILSMASTLQQVGLVHTSAGKAGFITAMYMLLVPVFNLILFRRRSPWLVWFAVATGVAGMYLLCIKDGFSLEQGDAYIAVCAVFYCFHILCADRYTEYGDPIGISAVQFATAAVLTTAVAFVAETPTMSQLLSAAVPILYCGIMSSGVAFTLQIVGQKY
ncbi:MAG: DMT family transporter, partial [Spirochaetales bacterium]|nr:DMT family transporter [Spirochaetales bacterium]